MDIAGGIYLETCEVPTWNKVLGSGGRAALAVSKISEQVTLHSYSPRAASDTIFQEFHENRVNLQLTASSSTISFAYFHPLSRPLIGPPDADLNRCAPIEVSGAAVLRFGFLEGQAIVTAGRAVYDPQSPNHAEWFEANGSSADELVVVLNRDELTSMTGISKEAAAVGRIFEQSRPVAVIVKLGAAGAVLYERSGNCAHVPVYLSDRVFKIGTGDVFSACLAHAWAELGVPLLDAANQASLAVANYVSGVLLPLPSQLISKYQPLFGRRLGTVQLMGEATNLGKRYLAEEAKYCLEELGVQVVWEDSTARVSRHCSTALVLADTFRDLTKLDSLLNSLSFDNLVILSEERVNISQPKCSRLSTDFTTAMYLSAWASMS